MALDPVLTRPSGWTDCAPGGGPGTDATVLQLRFEAVAARALTEAKWTPQPAPTPRPAPQAPDVPEAPPEGQSPTPGPVQPGPAPEPPVTPEERRLMDRIRGEVADDPRAQRAFGELVTSSDYRSLSPEARVAVLNQARNYPDARSIHNLQRLCGRDWFRGASLEDQQRFAKVIAFASQYEDGDARILGNTLDRILGDDDFKLEWYDFEPEVVNGKTVTKSAEQRLDYDWLIFGAYDRTKLDRGRVPAGNGPIDASDKDQVAMAVETLAHETNHHVNHDVRELGTNGSYRDFVGEYRAWYVGYQAAHGHPPSVEEAYDRARGLLGVTGGGYGPIGDTFRDVHSGDAKRMVAFLARLMGLDPATATREQVLDPSNIRILDASVASGLPPEVVDPSTAAAPPPETADADDPGNLDNG